MLTFILFTVTLVVLGAAAVYFGAMTDRSLK
jgi:hypothetical protein